MSVLAGDFQITADGHRLATALKAAILEVEVWDGLNLPSMFRFKLDMSQFAGTRGVELERFKPGTSVTVGLGLEDTVPLVTGRITALAPSFGDAYTTLEVRGYDRLYNLFFGKHIRNFSDMTDGQIATEIVEQAGLVSEAESPDTIHGYVVQHNLSNHAFLLDRVRRIRYEMGVRGENIFYMHASREGETPEVTLRFRSDITVLDLRLRTLTMGGTVQTRAWDYVEKEVITGEAAAPGFDALMGGRQTGRQLSAVFPESPLVMTSFHVGDEASAEQLAQAVFDEELGLFIEGEGTCRGNQRFRAGANVMLQDFDTRFDGVYYLVGTTHRFDRENGYWTNIRVRRTGL